MMSDRGVEWDHGGRIVVGVLVAALVQTVVGEVPSTFVEDGEGVSLVVDQYSVGAFLAGAANESLGRAVRWRGPGRNLDHVDVVSR
jgi:hypothetical protein